MKRATFLLKIVVTSALVLIILSGLGYMSGAVNGIIPLTQGLLRSIIETLVILVVFFVSVGLVLQVIAFIYKTPAHGNIFIWARQFLHLDQVALRFERSHSTSLGGGKSGQTKDLP
jgi:hypothetical protein